MKENKTSEQKESFYSKLDEKGIIDTDYERAKKVWELFNCRQHVNTAWHWVGVDCFLYLFCFSFV